MKYDFDWGYVAAGAPYITISNISLGFNSPAIALLSAPEDVAIGFDEKHLTIGVTDAKNIPGARSYKFASRVKSGWVRIGCKDFIKNLSELTGLSFSPARKFVAQYDAEEKILYVTVAGKEEDEK